MQIAKVGAYSRPIPGAIETLAALRTQGLENRLLPWLSASSDGCTPPMARAEGIEVDHVLAGDDLPAGASGAYMALANMLALHAPDVSRCVKVDDTSRVSKKAAMPACGLLVSPFLVLLLA